MYLYGQYYGTIYVGCWLVNQRKAVVMNSWFEYYFDQFKCILDIVLTMLLGIGLVASFIYGLFILVIKNT